MFKVKTKTKIEEAMLYKKTEKYNKLVNESQLDICNFEEIIKKIIESCTKDNIGNGRNFIFNKNLNEKQIEMVCYYLQQKIMNKESNDDARLHLIYFMNDMIHHGNKKNIEILKKHLAVVIIPCFSYAIENICDEKRAKMNKLLDLWEKNKYFSVSVIQMLRAPSVNWKIYEEETKNENCQISERITLEDKAQLNTYEKQNTEFIDHSNNQINFIQMQINQIIQQQIAMVIFFIF